MSNNEEIKYFCDVCQYETKNKYSFNRHNKTKMHEKRMNNGTKENIYNCSDCSYTTKDKSNFNRHKKAHTETIVHKYYCKLCDLSFRDMYNLGKHKESKTHYKKMAELNERTIEPLRTYENINSGKFTALKIQQKIKNKTGIFKKQDIIINKRVKGKNQKYTGYKAPPTKADIEEEEEEKQKIKVLTKAEVEEIKNNVIDYDLSIVECLLFNVKDEYQKKDFTEQYKQKPTENELYDLIYDLCEEILCDL